MTRRSVLLGAAALCVAAAAGAPAFAHRMVVFAWRDGDVVRIRARFAGERAARDAAVRVFDAADALLFETRTDDAGAAVYPFDRDAAAQGLRIVVDDENGHEDEFILTPIDLADDPAASTN